MPEKNVAKQGPARRQPSQQRALDKIGLMFEAAIRILEQDGLQGFTTNRVAELAGISIGTLYQYFPNKEALLLALAKREMKQTFERLRTEMQARADAAQATDAAPHQGARMAVRAILGAFGGRMRAREQMLEIMARSGQAGAIDAQIDAMTQGLLLGWRAPLDAHAEPLDAMQAFVLGRAVMGVLRAALRQDVAMLNQPAFEDALVRLVVGYLAGSRPAR